MTKRLIAFLMVLVLALSIASMALADGWDYVYGTGTCVFEERGGCPDPEARMGYGRRYAGGPGSWCTYCCLN